MDPFVSTFVFAAQLCDRLVGHEGSENLSVLGELLNQRPVQINILSASSHGATEIYQLFTARHLSLSQYFFLQLKSSGYKYEVNICEQGQVRNNIEIQNTNIIL